MHEVGVRLHAEVESLWRSVHLWSCAESNRDKDIHANRWTQVTTRNAKYANDPDILILIKYLKFDPFSRRLGRNASSVAEMCMLTKEGCVCIICAGPRPSRPGCVQQMETDRSEASSSVFAGLTMSPADPSSVIRGFRPVSACCIRKSMILSDPSNEASGGDFAV